MSEYLERQRKRLGYFVSSREEDFYRYFLLNSLKVRPFLSLVGIGVWAIDRFIMDYRILEKGSSILDYMEDTSEGLIDLIAGKDLEDTSGLIKEIKKDKKKRIRGGRRNE